MFDDNDETCWNSHQGTPQHIIIEFKENQHVKEVEIMFQGGFVGKNCFFQINDEKTINFYPDEGNKLQVKRNGTEFLEV